MRILFASEHRLVRLPDGTHWGEESFHKAVQRYRRDGVDVVAMVRVTPQLEPPESAARLTPEVAVLPLAPYRGLSGTLLAQLRVRRTVTRAVADSDRAVVRVPGAIGTLVARNAIQRGLPLLAEIVGDPHDVFGPASARERLRPLIRVVARRQLQWVASRASVTCYVTMNALQRRYPPHPGRPTFEISDVDVPDTLLQAVPRVRHSSETYRLAAVVSLERPYKRVDLLLELVRSLRQEGLDAEALIIGGGRLSAEYEDLAGSMDVPATFTGQLARDQALRALTTAHAIVSTSFVEGLPRALIEGMALGLPAFAFDVGGIAELAPGVSLAQPGDIDSMCEAILASADPVEYPILSARAIGTARRYVTERLREKSDLLVRTFLEET